MTLKERAEVRSPEPELELLIKEARRRRRRRWARNLAVVALALVLAGTGLALSASSGSSVLSPAQLRFPRDRPSGLPRSRLSDWLYLSEATPGEEKGNVVLHSYSFAGRFRNIVLPIREPSQSFLQAVGHFVVGIAGLTRQGAQGANGQGEAFSVEFSTGGGVESHTLGRANYVLPAEGGNDVWLETIHESDPPFDVPSSSNDCSLHEVSLLGRSHGPLEHFPCRRLIFAALPGGFLSFPRGVDGGAPVGIETPTFGPEPLQVWDANTSKVVRTIAPRVAWIVGVSSAYVAWQPQTKRYNTVELTNLKTFATVRFTMRPPRGYTILPGPSAEESLAPSGPYIAGLFVSHAFITALHRLPPAEKCCIQPGINGRAILGVFDALSGRKLLMRPVTLYSATNLYWTGDDGFIAVANGLRGLDPVPLWSTRAPIHRIQTRFRLFTPDNENGTVVSTTRS